MYSSLVAAIRIWGSRVAAATGGGWFFPTSLRLGGSGQQERIACARSLGGLTELFSACGVEAVKGVSLVALGPGQGVGLRTSLTCIASPVDGDVSNGNKCTLVGLTYIDLDLLSI